MFLLLTLKGFTRSFANATSAGLAVARQMVKAAVNRRAVWTLSHADDRLLKDIGLTRSDILAALDLPLYRDPSLNLADHAGVARIQPGSPMRGSIGDPDGSKRVRRDVEDVKKRSGISKLPMVGRLLAKAA